MPIWQLCANLLIPNCLRSNLSYSPLAALELYVIFWYTIGFITIIFWGIGLIIMIWETIAVIRHKNKQLRYAKYLVQRDKIKQ